MPFYNGGMENIEMYIETLEILQDIVDTYGDAGQIMFLGDFNAALPQQRELSRNWYKMRPFNKHSLLLYDFLCDNDLLVCNFDYRQNVNFTYFKGTHHSYIDHCIMPIHSRKWVKDCKILSDHPDNSNDHFPIYVNLTVPGVKNGSKNYTRATTQNRTFID